jgi:hypothetical protein
MLAGTGELAQARAELGKAAAMAQEHAFSGLQLCNLVSVAELAAAQGWHAVAARLIGAIEAAEDNPRGPDYGWYFVNAGWILSRVRSAASEELLAQERPAGRAMTLDQAVAYGLDQTNP